jgi:hypothetical protein
MLDPGVLVGVGVQRLRYIGMAQLARDVYHVGSGGDEDACKMVSQVMGYLPATVSVQSRLVSRKRQVSGLFICL